MDGPRPRFMVPVQGGRGRSQDLPLAAGLELSPSPAPSPVPAPPPSPSQQPVPTQRPTTTAGRAAGRAAGRTDGRTDGRAVPPPPAGDERFRALFEHVPVGVALSEPGGRFTDVNHALRALLEGTGIDPDVDGPADLARPAEAAAAEAEPDGAEPDGAEAAEADQAAAWRAGLADVTAGRATVAQAQLSLAPAGAPPRWVQATAALVVLGDHRYLLTHVEDTTGRHLAEQRLVRLALHDDLTGLANRTLLAERLEAAVARDEGTGLHTGVLYVDLDAFKQVNDRFGHEIGDRVLRCVGYRLAASLRAGDTAGRVGGDEFLVIAGDVPDGAALSELARRLTAALAAPFDVPGCGISMQASVGATLVRPGDTLATAMQRADAAMFTVKRGRRATARVDVDALQLTLLPELAAPDPPGPPT